MKNAKNTKDIYEGIYRVAAKNFGFVIIDDGEEIFVPSKDSLNALTDDKVLVKITSDKNSEKKSREGQIVKILEKVNDVIVGYFEPSKNYAFVTPISKKIPFDIHIEKKYWGKAVKDSIVEVKLLKKKNSGANPEGAVVNIIGHKDDPNDEITAIVHDFKIKDQFDIETKKEADSVAVGIKPLDLKNRTDLRKELFITIDGEDTKDIDDAICLKDNGNNKVLYVSIADVSHYVKEKSFLDEEALKRGNSVYLLDRVIPMLPHVLSNGMCSLNEGEDRLTLTCEMTFDNQGKIIAHNIYQSVINSKKRMTYTEVQEIIDDVTSDSEKNEITHMIKEMILLSRKIRKRRYDRGSINFDLKETYIKVDDNLKPIEITEKERIEAYELIEDFMVSANETVAEEFYFMDIPFLYRTHEATEKDKLDTFVRTMNALSIPFNYNTKNKLTSMDIQKLLKSVQGKPYEKVVEKLALRSMSQAKYTKKLIGHFALASKYYTHFTSPIRRYSDLQIHRIIHEVIDGKFDESRREHYDKILDAVALKISKTERVAIDCERDVEALKKCEYMKQFIGDEFDGTISGLTNFGIFVELDNTVEGMISLRDIRDDHYVMDEEKYRVVGEKKRRTFSFGDKLKVQLVKCTPEIRAIDFVLVD